jgi:signal transduction protein with GAF and PtsI domain
VPILRGGNTLGVLVAQNRAHRLYSEEEVEALQTTAMVLAEMLASGELRRWPGRAPTSPCGVLSHSRARRWLTALASATWCCTSRASSSPT